MYDQLVPLALLKEGSMETALVSFLWFRKVTGKELLRTTETKFGPFKMILEDKQNPIEFFVCFCLFSRF